MAHIISGKYEVISELGRGGMGVVYKVRHTTLETTLALKVLPSYFMENQEMVARFRREARVMARLKHPNIVGVQDFDQDEDQNFYYLLMEYIRGKTLKELSQEKGPLPLPEVLEICGQVASALGYAHNYNPPIIHRDIKPANIMIEEGSGRVVVMDFGIAKDLGESEMTKSGVMIGTLKYSSPEQMRQEPIDGSADVYSLGMVMYEIYTGTQFFAGLDEHAVIGKILYDSQENEAHFIRPPPAGFAGLVTKAIAKSRERRYQRMEDLLRDLEACRSALDDTGTIILPALGSDEPSAERERSRVQDIEEQIQKLEEERQRRIVLPLQAQVREARERAAHEGALQWAATLFQQGLSQEERGSEQLREKNYESARDAYQEAVGHFNQACEEAIAAAVFHGAEQARQGMADTKAEAERYGARERAHTFYGRGLTLQAQADELWESEKYPQAGQAYAEARSAFADARDLAYRKTLREEAEAARMQLGSAKETAMSEGAEELAPVVFREAADNEQRANTAVDREEFTQARELYNSARQKYELAQQQAYTEQQRQQALAVQQQAKEVQCRAKAAGAKQDSHAAYRQAANAQRQGDTRVEAQEYEQAALEYEQARKGYEQAAQEAERERARRAVEAARQQMEKTGAAAERVRAKDRLGEEFAQVQRLAEQGRENEGRGEFAEALDLYEQAERLAAQELAEAARRKVVEAREEAKALAPKWAPAKWSEAQGLETKAEQAWQAGEYQPATEFYEQAGQGYEEARVEAEQERLRQQAVEASRQAEQGQVAAQQAEAGQYARDLYQEAIEAKGRGEQSLEARRWEEAEEGLIQARALFTRGIQGAHHEKARQAAGAARERALAAQREAREGKGAELFPGQFAEARGLFVDAERTFEREDFGTAQAGFERSAVLFQQISRNASVRLQREQAEQARARAQELQEKALAGKRRQMRQANKVLVEGNRLFQQGEYAEAQASYEKAASLFAALQPQESEATKTLILPPKEEPSPVPHRSHWFSMSIDPALWKKSHFTFFVGLGSLAVIFVYSLYSWGPFRSTVSWLGEVEVAKVPLAPAKVPPAPKVTEQPLSPSRSYKVTTLTAVRDNPTWTGQEMNWLKPNMKIQVVAIVGDWLKVESKSDPPKPGYVWKDDARPE